MPKPVRQLLRLVHVERVDLSRVKKAQHAHLESQIIDHLKRLPHTTVRIVLGSEGLTGPDLLRKSGEEHYVFTRQASAISLLDGQTFHSGPVPDVCWLKGRNDQLRHEGKTEGG